MSVCVLALVRTHVVCVWPRLTLAWGMAKHEKNRSTGTYLYPVQWQEKTEITENQLTHILLKCWTFEGWQRHWVSNQNVMSLSQSDSGLQLWLTTWGCRSGSGASRGETNRGVQRHPATRWKAIEKAKPRYAGLKGNVFSRKIHMKNMCVLMVCVYISVMLSVFLVFQQHQLMAHC